MNSCNVLFVFVLFLDYVEATIDIDKSQNELISAGVDSMDDIGNSSDDRKFDFAGFGEAFSPYAGQLGSLIDEELEYTNVQLFFRVEHPGPFKVFPGLKLSCYSTQTKKKMTSCRGACVIKSIHFANGSSTEILGCEFYGIHYKIMSNKCSNYNIPRQYENTSYIIEYTTKRKEYIYKLCCFKSYCNTKKSLDMPLHFIYKWGEARLVDDHGLSGSLIASFIFLLLVAKAGWMLGRLNRKSNLEIGANYVQTIKRDLEREATVALPVGRKKKQIPKVSGILNLRETAVVISQINAFASSKSKSSRTNNTPSTYTTQHKTVCIKTPLWYQASGHGHTLIRCNRIGPTSMESMLSRLVEHGPYMFPFKTVELLELFEETRDIICEEGSLLTVENPVVLISDIRGSYADLHRWLEIVGWPPHTRLLFLGNYMDDEDPGSLECLALICALKIAFPDDVYMLRGATELLPFSPRGRFPIRTADAIGNAIKRLFSYLPSAAIVGDKIFVVPGGPSPLIKERKDMMEQPESADLEELTELQRHLIFNRPSNSVRMYRPEHKMIGDNYGHIAVRRLCEQLDLVMLVRGSAPCAKGYLPLWKNRVISLWSSPSKMTNVGAVLHVSKDFEITPVILYAQEDDA